ncbi:hypothetical protein GCL60_15355 [Silvanigrella paludirubra]|uniref:Uncharacterized protein n=1 Tax=Silvanigrella paludirubra TaxID=2499159 RepID=A0A6N6VUD9_9BACT|nr:metallophosphoesterase [Silvanigrella paludirubra]KAB8036502.1 hypothetical protein GCL60_15355 [Silvanigrella paludirubra]
MFKRNLVIFGFFIHFLFPLKIYANKSIANFIAISDIHFNPFDLCYDKSNQKNCIQLINELNKSDSNKWNSIFKKYYKNNTFPSYGQNTNFPLFQSLLTELNQASKNTNLIFAVILGDFLAHQYIENYKIYTNDSSLIGAQNFVKKTFQYLTSEIRGSIPSNIEIYPVIGNNDSYIDNYNVDNPKTTKFYSDLKNIWTTYSSQIKSSNTFLNGGYYVAQSQIKKLSIIALNTNSFSRNAISKDKADIKEIAQQQLDWLNDQFNNAKDQKFILISHIPCGVDVYSSFNSMIKGGDPVTFWNSNPKFAEKPYMKILSNNFLSISGILVSHTHNDSFQIINNDLGLFASYVPSISPAHYNNSGYKIFTIDEGNNLSNAISFYFDPSYKTWKEAYNFNETYESPNLFIGMQSLIGKWNKDPDEIDEKYLKNFNLNADISRLKNKWKYYVCGSADNIDVIDYQDCINPLK